MPATDHAVALTRTAARAAAEKKAGDIVAIDVSERLVLTYVFLIPSGDKAGAKRRIREGLEEAHWVLIDYTDVIIHVQQGEDR